LSAEHAESLPEYTDGHKIYYGVTNVGPKIEIAFEEKITLALVKELYTSPCLSAVWSLSSE
jgi:hypothetical protein